MPISSALRTCPAVWVGPVLAVLAMLASSYISVTIPEPYPLALTSAGASSLFLVAPVCAACAAWEGGRLRRAGWHALPHVRSTLVVALASLAPVVVVGLIAVALAIAFKFVGASAMAAPDPRVVAKTIVVLLAHALLGFAIGVRVPSVVAVSSVLLVDYAWMVLPIGLEPLWLRHLNGTWLSCCGLPTDLSPRAFAGVVVVAVGLAGTAVFLMGQPVDLLRLSLSVVPTAVGVSAGVLLVQGMGPDPVAARDPSVLVCSSGQPRVCVWPEHYGRLDEVSAIAAEASKAWRRFGIAVPAEFTEYRSALSSGTNSFGFSLTSRRSDIIISLANSLLPPMAQCEGKPFLGGAAGSYARAWFGSVAGLSHAELRVRFGPDVVNKVAAVQSLSVERQRAWLERNLAAWQACDVAPQLDPVT